MFEHFYYTQTTSLSLHSCSSTTRVHMTILWWQSYFYDVRWKSAASWLFFSPEVADFRQCFFMSDCYPVSDKSLMVLGEVNNSVIEIYHLHSFHDSWSHACLHQPHLYSTMAYCRVKHQSQASLNDITYRMLYWYPVLLTRGYGNMHACTWQHGYMHCIMLTCPASFGVNPQQSLFTPAVEKKRVRTQVWSRWQCVNT